MSILLIVLDKNSSRLANLRSTLSVVLYPVMALVDWPSGFVKDFQVSAYSFFELKNEVRRLKELQFVSDIKLLKFAALEKENIRLRSLLESSYNIGEQVLVGEILSVNFDPFDHVVLVNKGARFGVHLEQPVLDTQGVIGQVVRTLPLTSEIMLITDPNHAIPVQVNRNGLRTIAVGSGQLNRLILPYLPNNADIKKGDLLITSGMGGTFPQGYPVAVIDDFQIQPRKPFAFVSAVPKAALDKIREVLIVWSDAKSVPLNLPDITPVPVPLVTVPSVANKPSDVAMTTTVPSVCPPSVSTDKAIVDKQEKTPVDPKDAATPLEEVLDPTLLPPPQGVDQPEADSE